MSVLIFLSGLFAVMFAIGRYSLSFRRAALVSVVFLLLFTFAGGFNLFFGILIWVLLLIPSLLFAVPELRQNLLSYPLLKRIRAILPPMSDTEKDAIEAGTVWWESELFRGAPDWNQLLQYKTPELNDEEQAFIDGPVNRLCEMIDDWDITHNRMDLPKEVWNYLKKQGFLA